MLQAGGWSRWSGWCSSCREDEKITKSTVSLGSAVRNPLSPLFWHTHIHTNTHKHVLSLTCTQGNCRAEWRGDRDAGRQPSSLHQVLAPSRSWFVRPQALRRIRSHTWAAVRCHVGFLGPMRGVAKKNSCFFLFQSLTWAWVDLYVQSIKSPLLRPWLLFFCDCKFCQGTKGLWEKLSGCAVLEMPRTQKMILKPGFEGHRVSNENHFN